MTDAFLWCSHCFFSPCRMHVSACFCTVHLFAPCSTAARAGPADGDVPMASTRDDGPLPSRDDGRDEAVESRKRQLSRSPSPDRADRRSRSPEVKRARSRSPERGSKVEREGGHDPVARSGSDEEGGRSRRDD